MATIVLVPGAYLGAWAWQDVASHLRARGHDVHAMTLTGLGERRHLARPDVDLETHVTDIVNHLTFEDLSDAVLVGHSYSGVVVTPVADRVPERIAGLVYVDTSPLPDGVSLMDIFSADDQAALLELVRTEGDGWLRPVMSLELLEEHGISHAGMTPEQVERVWRKATPQPFATHTQPVRLDGRIPGDLPRTMIVCTAAGRSRADVEAAIAAQPRLAALLGTSCRLIEMDTGHYPMFSAPQELSDLLHEAAHPIRRDLPPHTP
jgi:pimeloyl-ACP methyl ester carboxylesterase